MAQVRVTPSGFMDKDTELSYVSQGNYVDALNVRHRGIDSSGGDYMAVTPIKGNSLAVTIPNYSPESQTYRVLVDVEQIYNGSLAGALATLTLESSTGVIYTKTNANYLSTNLAAAVTVIKNDLNYLSNLLFGGLFTYSATTVTKTESGTDIAGYFDVTTTVVNSFVLRVDNIEGTYCTFEKNREYHNESGSFEIVGSAQLDDDLFVLLAGDDKNADGTSIISEIGVIYPSGSAFAYTKLLRSQKLRFSQDKKHDTQIERVGSQINIYTTDNNVSPKAFYIDYALKRTADGMLFATGGRYNLDTVNIETSLFLNPGKAYLRDLQVLEGEGNLTAGNKR